MFTNLFLCLLTEHKTAQLCPWLPSRTAVSLHKSGLFSPRVPSHLPFLSTSPNWIKLAVELFFLFSSFTSKEWYQDSKNVQYWSKSLFSAECHFSSLMVISVPELWFASATHIFCFLFRALGSWRFAAIFCCFILMVFTNSLDISFFFASAYKDLLVAIKIETLIHSIMHVTNI